MKLLPALPLLLLAAPAAAQVPSFDAAWIGYDTARADEARWPWQMRAGDLDGDGDPDYAVVSGPSIPGLSILLNEGNGGFADPVVYDTPGSFWDDVQDLELVDLDGDGDLDVVAAITGSSGFGTSVTVHLNHGDGTFAPFVEYPTGQGPTGVTAADLDGDGFQDVVTANYGYIGQGSTISVLRGDGSGGLRSPVHVAVGPSPRRVAAADLDGDGDPDLGVALEDETLVVLSNHGGLSFTQQSYPVFAVPYAGTLHAAVEFGDMDQDGHLDAVYTSTKCGFGGFSGTGAVGILHNRGDGTFDPPVKLETPPETQGGAELALADWNGDGWLDVASAHDFDGEWILFESDGRGGYLPARVLGAGASAIAVDGTDVTGDGLADVVVLGRASNELCVYRNTGGGGEELQKNPIWPFVLTLPGIFDPILFDGLDAADVDGDGDLDLGIAYHKIQGLDGGQSVLRNLGDGTFAQADVYHTDVGAANFAFAELDGDGWVDMLSTDAGAGRLRRRLNDGTGGFGPEQSWSFANGVKDLVAFDVDQDGDVDAVAVASKSLLVKRNDGSGSFPAPTTAHSLTTFAEVLAHGDLDGDGIQDVVTDSSFIGIEASLGNGDGTFQAPIGSFADWGIKGVVLADFDQDGVLDAATSAWSNGDHGHPTVQVLLGWGDGAFKLPQTYLGSHQQGTGSNAGDVVAADFDSDGHLDLATGNYWSLDVSTFLNRGDGTFDPQVRYGHGSTTIGTVAGDFDGDGIADVAVGVSTGPAIDFFPGAIVLPSTAAGAWKDLGSGLAGTAGVPELAATPLVGGEPMTLSLASAAPSAPGALVAGFAKAPLPLFGGVLVPRIDVVIPLTTDSTGEASFAFPWPTVLPPGFTLYAQAGVLDSAAVQGIALSNALQGTQY